MKERKKKMATTCRNDEIYLLEVPFAKLKTSVKNYLEQGLHLSANVNSQITDRLRYSYVISKQTHLFSNICKCYCNHRQMSAKMKMKNNT